jgi:hypothetical protein
VVDRVFVQMWGPFRERLIANHEFYVAEAKRRLLAQFNDDAMKADADRHAEEWLASRAQYFNPDRDDPSDAYEQSWDEAVSFYRGLVDLQKTTRLSIIAGMYHEWEKQLRDWLGREMGHHGLGEHTHAAIWKVVIGDIFDFVDCWQWHVRDRPFHADLHICHLVVNVYKHGNGNSFNELRKEAPSLVGAKAESLELFSPTPDYTNLEIGDDELERFSQAIISFWRDVPENVFFSQLTGEPKWLRNAVKKDLPK